MKTIIHYFWEEYKEDMFRLLQLICVLIVAYVLIQYGKEFALR